MPRPLKPCLICFIFVTSALAGSTWSPTGSMASARRDHAAVLLPNGKVLVAGYVTSAAEMYDPAAGRFAYAGTMQFLHGQGLTATLLKSGQVLIVGGTYAPSNAELFDPTTGRFIAATATVAPHSYHSATLLNDGRVLIAGGLDAGAASSAVAEIYDPASGAFTSTGSLSTPREGHTATPLPDGRVLVAGGIQVSSAGADPLNSAETYDPAAGTFTPTLHAMAVPRYTHYAVLLATGEVLIGGGFPDITAELFDPAQGTFTLTGSMTVARGAATATLLSSGQVLVAGGFTGGGPAITATAELYDPNTGLFSATGSMATARDEFTATLLFDGRVLVTGGFGGQTDLASAELYTAVTQGLVTSQNGLTFSVAASNSQTVLQNIVVLSSTAIPWSSSVNTYAGGSWLSTNPPSATSSTASPVAMTIAANPSGLAAGVYYGIVTLTPKDGLHPAVSISVVLDIVPPNTSVPPLVNPTGLVFLATPGAVLNSQTVSISNVTSHAVGATLTASGSTAWLSFTPKFVVAPAGQTGTFSVAVATTNLAVGVYRGSINLAFTDTTTQVVDVLLVIAPVPSQTSQALRKEPRGAAASACTPTVLLPVFTTLATGFSAPDAWPTPLVVNVVDDCTNPLTAGAVTVSFGNGDPPLALLSLGDGNWTSTWVPGHNGQGFSITATANLAQPPLQGSVQVTGQVPLNPAVPVVNPLGVLSAADYIGSPALGLLVSIFGSELSDETASAPGVPLPKQLGASTVFAGGEALPILYVSATQINVVIPYDLMPTAQYQLLVQRGSAISVPVPISVLAAQPAILSTNGSGSGQGHIYRISGTNALLADSQSPASAGDALVVYCAGLGNVSPAVPAGSGAPLGGPLSNTAASVSLTIGGQPAQVLFAGLTPGFPGLYQVNAMVPNGVAAGNQVPVTVSVAGQNSIGNISMAIQ